MNDSISRQAAIQAIDDLPNCYNGFSDTYDKAQIIGVLEELPSVQPEQKTGTWERRYVSDYRFHLYCSVCGGWQTHGDTKYCPYCGARMDGGYTDD